MHKTIYDIAKILIVFLGYIFTAKLGLSMPYVGSHITLIWLPTGIAVAAFAYLGIRVAPAIFIAAFFVNYSISPNILLSVAIGAGNTLAPLVAYIFLKKTNFDHKIEHRRDILLLITAAFSSMLISSVVGSYSLIYFGILPPEGMIYGWITWWLGDSIGVLLGTPLLLTLFAPNGKKTRASKMESAIWFALLLGGAFRLFLFHCDTDTVFPFILLFIPFIAWASLRFDIRTSSFGIILLAVIAAYGTSLGYGVFNAVSGQSGLLFLWLFITTTVTINLLINALLAEILIANNTMREQAKRLTNAENIANLGTWRYFVKEDRFETSKITFKIIESFKDCKQSMKALIESVHPEDRATVQEAFGGAIKEGHPFEITHRMLASNGSIKYVSAHGRPTTDVNKNIITIDGTLQDITQTQQTTEELRSLKQKYQLLFDDSPDAYLIMETETGAIIDCNKVSATMLGGSRSQIIGLTSDNLSPKYQPSGNLSKEAIREKIAECIKNGKSKFEWLHTRLDGEEFWVEVTTSIVKLDEKQVLFAAWRDISELKKLKSNIENERNFISTMINNANAVIAVIRTDGVMSLINEYGEKFIGYTKEEIASTPYFWSRFLNEEKRGRVVDIIEQAKAGNIVKSFQNTWISKSGEERMFEWSNTLVKKKDGSMDYLFTIGIDISKQYEYSQKIKEESLLKTLALKTGDIGTWEWRFDSNTLVWDDVMYKIYGIPENKTENLYEAWNSAIDKPDRVKIEESLSVAKETNGECNVFFWITTPDNRRKYIHAIGKNELNRNGIPTRMIGINIDITKQKTYEEELEKKVVEETAKHLEKERLLIQQSRLAAMGEMISNIAHQWRQPLNQISALKDELIEDYYFKELDDEKIELFKKRVGNSLQYMSATIDDFRNFFKPDKEKTSFKIGDSITHTLSLLADSMKSVDIVVNTDIRLDGAKAFGYPNEFAQALINILNNAKDALKTNNKSGNRRIDIGGYKNKDLIVVSVQDNAGGIPKDIINKIFDPYFTTKHKSQGTGLGLYMSKIIIEQSLAGRLTVSNQNEGACFLIKLKAENTEEDKWTD